MRVAYTLLLCALIAIVVIGGGVMLFQTKTGAEAGWVLAGIMGSLAVLGVPFLLLEILDELKVANKRAFDRAEVLQAIRDGKTGR